MILCAAARAAGSVQVDPIARLTLEGGYDSNPLYDGGGADNVGRVSPDLGLQLRAPTWSFAGSAGGDLLAYQHRASTPVWNQRGRVLLDGHPEERWTFHADADAAYAADPIGLARYGIFGRGGTALIGGGRARVAYELDRTWRLAGTFRESLVFFAHDDGAASHQPGIELTRELSHRLELGAAYRFDLFDGFGPTATDATAHELQVVARWQVSHRTRLEAEGGPALWNGPGGGTTLLPQAAVALLWMGRAADARVALRHGVGLGNLATPGLIDSVEAGVTAHLGRSWLLHADGGVWRSGTAPWGADATIGYGLEGEVAYLFGGGFRVAVGGGRFARADTDVTTYDRTTIGLRMGWELGHR